MIILSRVLNTISPLVFSGLFNAYNFSEKLMLFNNERFSTIACYGLRWDNALKHEGSGVAELYELLLLKLHPVPDNLSRIGIGSSSICGC
jgi:hypothetical protein